MHAMLGRRHASAGSCDRSAHFLDPFACISRAILIGVAGGQSVRTSFDWERCQDGEPPLDRRKGVGIVVRCRAAGYAAPSYGATVGDVPDGAGEFAGRAACFLQFWISRFRM